MVDSFASFVWNPNLLFKAVTNPAVPTGHILWPLTRALLSFSSDGHSDDSIPYNHNQLIRVVVKIVRTEANEDGDLHSWCDIS